MIPKRTVYVGLVMLVAVAAVDSPALAQSGIPAPEAGVPDQRSITAFPIEASIAVDGRLDEPAWQQAEPVSGFRQFEPDEGEPAAYPTEVRVLYGDNSLYVGAYLYDDQPGRIQQTLSRRDEFNQADWFSVSIDSYLDRKTAYTFAVNAAGVQYDALRSSENDERGRGPAGGGDPSWDAIWSSDVRVTPEGWIAEIQIPYSMLRFSEAESQTWGVHFSREIPRLGEKSEWPLVPRTDRANLVARYGLLQGITGIEPRRNIQITPYTVSRLRTREAPDRSGELVHESSLDVGGDLKVGLGSNIILDLTVNPDFGQVESDPAELNLTAFETFFQEQRPFFIEGTQIFQFPTIGRGSLLYTRRIGAQAPVIGAAKLSGRTPAGLSFGVLGASTGNNFDPSRQYGVVRLIQEIGSFSSVGGMLTGFDGFAGNVHQQSVSGGANWDLRFRDNTYGVTGFAAFTHGLGMEPGFSGQVMAGRRQGAWTYEFGGDFIDHRFNPNDVGRQRGNNQSGVIVRFDHDVNAGQPFGPFQRARFGGAAWHQWSYREGINLGSRIGIQSNWTLRNFQSFGLRVESNNFAGGYDLFETRGLWPRAQPLSVGVGAEYETDERRDWQVEPGINLAFEEDGGRTFGVGLRTNWNVGSRLSLRGDVEAEWEDGVIDWSSNETFRRDEGGWMIGAEARPPEALDPETFVPVDDPTALDAIFSGVEPYDASGQYYVPLYGARDSRALDLTLRSSYTFTPDLALQFYGQFFVARAQYDHFQILQDPDVLAPFDAFPKRNEFSLSSFQFNAVLRWEYRPGSELYLVWTQGRRAEDTLNPLAPWRASPYDTPISDQISDTFGIFPDNVFLIKLNYTFLY